MQEETLEETATLATTQREIRPARRRFDPIALTLRLAKLAGIDKAISYALLSRTWSTAAGVVTLFMITHYLRPDEQGFYYAFSSVLGLQILFELGFSYTVMQCASHERALLEWTRDGKLTGPEVPKQRLAALFGLALKWYGWIALITFSVVLPAGLIFLAQTKSDIARVSWRGPWVWLAFTESLMLLTSPFFAFLEGAGLVAQVALVRCATNILTSVALWYALWRGWALLAPPVVSSVGIVASSIWISVRWKNYFQNLLRTPVRPGILSWRAEVWPFQWRIVISWVSYYFLSQLTIPVLFRYRGAVTAGQMGLSVSLLLAAQAAGIAWMTTKAPRFGVHVARREFRTLDKVFFTTFVQAMGVLSLLGVTLFCAVSYIGATGSAYKERVVAPAVFAFLVGRMLVECGVYFLSIYLRAHKQEPLLWISLANAVLVGVSTYVFGRFWGTLGMAAANFIAVSITLPFAVRTFFSKRRAWHFGDSGAMACGSSE